MLLYGVKKRYLDIPAVEELLSGFVTPALLDDDHGCEWYEYLAKKTDGLRAFSQVSSIHQLYSHCQTRAR